MRGMWNELVCVWTAAGVVVRRRFSLAERVAGVACLVGLALWLVGCARLGLVGRGGPVEGGPTAVVLDGEFVAGGAGVEDELVIWLPEWVEAADRPVVVEREGRLFVSVEVVAGEE